MVARAINAGWTRVAKRGGDAEVNRIGMLDGWQRELLGEFAGGSSVHDVATKRGMHPSKVKRELRSIYQSLDLCGRPTLPIIRAVSLFSTWEERQRLASDVHLPR